MAITLDLFEDSGPVLSGAGTTRNAVDNIGWKADGTDDTGNHYAFVPIVRPLEPEGLWSRSYKKYHFARLSGTYPTASRVRIKISNGINGTPPAGYEGESTLMGDDAFQRVRVFYKLSNVYLQPNSDWDGDLIYLPPGTTTLYPSVSTTGPNGTQAYPQYLSANTTYYTQYLITQLEVPYGTNIGNIGEVNIEWYVDEYEDGNI